MSRVYGRIPVNSNQNQSDLLNGTLDEFGQKQWVVVETDPNGDNDYLYITALIQCLKLNLGEAPFFGRDGIPAKAAVEQQIAPDFSVARIQAKYAPYFASLIISKQPLDYSRGQTPAVVYNIFIIRNNGSTYRDKVAL